MNDDLSRKKQELEEEIVKLQSNILWYINKEWYTPNYVLSQDSYHPEKTPKDLLDKVKLYHSIK